MIAEPFAFTVTVASLVTRALLGATSATVVLEEVQVTVGLEAFTGETVLVILNVFSSPSL